MSANGWIREIAITIISMVTPESFVSVESNSAMYKSKASKHARDARLKVAWSLKCVEHDRSAQPKKKREPSSSDAEAKKPRRREM